MRTLVTGGGGFIGSHLVDRLLADGHDVRVLDNFSTGDRGNLSDVAEHVEIVEGDVQSYERAHAAVRGAEVVFHQAALPSVPRSVQDPLTSNAVNVVGTLNIMLAARDAGVRRVVLASSSSVYGASEELPKHEGLPTLPMSPYAVGKSAAESYCRAFDKCYGLEAVALRYFNVFGPRQDPESQYAAVVPRFITRLLDGTSPTVFGDGEQSRDFTYIDNVVDANLAAADASSTGSGRAINIAYGQRISLNRLLDELRALTGSDVEAQYEPPRAGDVRHSHADVSLASELLGWTPRVSLRDGLGRCVEHYRAAASLAGPAAV